MQVIIPSDRAAIKLETLPSQAGCNSIQIIELYLLHIFCVGLPPLVPQGKLLAD